MADSHSTHTADEVRDGWAHIAIAQMLVCPLCFGAIAKQHMRNNKGIMLATLVCENDHLFSMSWGLAQVEA